LFAVTQGRVKNDQFVSHLALLLTRSSIYEYTKQKARSGCIRACLENVRARYRFRPSWRSSSSASENDFMTSMYHKSANP
jgi:hypothetical protein